MKLDGPLPRRTPKKMTPNELKERQERRALRDPDYMIPRLIWMSLMQAIMANLIEGRSNYESLLDARWLFEHIHFAFRSCLDAIPGGQDVFKMLVATAATMKMSSMKAFPASNYEPGWPVLMIPDKGCHYHFSISDRVRFLRKLPLVLRWVAALKGWSKKVLGKNSPCVFARLDDTICLLVYLRAMAESAERESHDDEMDEEADVETQEPQSLPPLSPKSDQTGRNGINSEESPSAPESQNDCSKSAEASRELMDLFEQVGQWQKRGQDPGPPRKYLLRDDVQHDFLRRVLKYPGNQRFNPRQIPWEY